MGISIRHVWPGILGVAASLIVPLAVSMAWAAEQHGHQGSAEQASAKKVIYREGGSVLHDRMMDEIKRQQEQAALLAGRETVCKCCS